VYVPAGWSMVGGDKHAAEPVPAHDLWIDGFVVKRTPVTVGEYLAFLDAIDPITAARFVPRGAIGGPDVTDHPLATRASGRWVIADPTTRLDWPVASIDWYAANAYARWHADQTGLPWRLPDELEWEKAARGVDGRAYPWGEQPEPTWARMLGSTSEVPTRAPVGTHPIDESPYGARDLAGNVREWCAGVWTPNGPASPDGVLERREVPADDVSMRVIRGGSWAAVPTLARCAGRFAARPHETFAWVGVRLVRSVGPSS
jgi:eukaryotic-like serine/threonine-protein kinase